MGEFPTLAELWPLYRQWKGLLEPSAVRLIEQPFHTDSSGRQPRYYQRVAINRAIENQMKSELAAALAHHFTDAEASDA